MKSYIVQKILSKLHRIITKSIAKLEFEKALMAIDACSRIQYHFNQYFVDEELEKALLFIEGNLEKTKLLKEDMDQNTVCFYDGVGSDTRGLVLIYLKAIVELGFNVIYVTTDKAKDRQKEIKNILKKPNCKIEYFDSTYSYLEKSNQLIQLFETYRPGKAFFYSFSFEVSAVIAFEHFKNIIERYQICLTDHGFWLGKYMFDKSIEFRELGANISYFYRNIPAEKIFILPYYPYIDYDVKFEGFPFDDKDKKVIFSGGNLIKTFDKKRTYYKMVELILKEHKDVIFLYAGGGNTSELKKLMKKFKGRVYFMQERKDLYEIMKHSYIYLNTYPIIGGLMTQYAAVAERVPLMLVQKENRDNEGILREQDKLGIMFYELKDLLDEVNLLLLDQVHLKNVQEKVKNSMISEREFVTKLSEIICSSVENRKIVFEKIDVRKIQEEFKYKVTFSNCGYAITREENKLLKSDFYLLFFVKKIKEMLSILNIL